MSKKIFLNKIGKPSAITGYKSREYLIKAIDWGLSKRDAKILKLRYGLLKEKKTKTFEEMRVICKLSRSRIQQIVTKEIVKIRVSGNLHIKKMNLTILFQFYYYIFRILKNVLIWKKNII